MLNTFHDMCFQLLLDSTDAGGFDDKLHSACIQCQEGGFFYHDRHCTNLYQKKAVASETNKREKEKH